MLDPARSDCKTNVLSLKRLLVSSGSLVLASAQQPGAGGVSHADWAVLEGPPCKDRRSLWALWWQIRFLQRYSTVQYEPATPASAQAAFMAWKWWKQVRCTLALFLRGHFKQPLILKIQFNVGWPCQENLWLELTSIRGSCLSCDNNKQLLFPRECQCPAYLREHLLPGHWDLSRCRALPNLISGQLSPKETKLPSLCWGPFSSLYGDGAWTGSCNLRASCEQGRVAGKHGQYKTTVPGLLD